MSVETTFHPTTNKLDNATKKRIDITIDSMVAQPVGANPQGQEYAHIDRIYPNNLRARNHADAPINEHDLKIGADNMLKIAQDLSAMLSKQADADNLADAHTHDHAQAPAHEHGPECLADSADVNPTPASHLGLSNEQKAKLAKTKTYFEYFAELMGVRLFKKYSPASGSVWNKHHIRPTSRFDLTETVSNAWDYTRSHVQNIIVYYLLIAIVAIFFPDAYNPTYLFRGWLIFTIYEFYLLMVHHYNRTLAGRVLAVLPDEDDEPISGCMLARHGPRARTKKTEEDPLADTPFLVEDVSTYGHIFPPTIDLNAEMAITRQPLYALLYRENRYPVANFISKDEAIAFGKELHARYQPQEMLDWFMNAHVLLALTKMRERTITDK